MKNVSVTGRRILLLRNRRPVRRDIPVKYLTNTIRSVLQQILNKKYIHVVVKSVQILTLGKAGFEDKGSS